MIRALVRLIRLRRPAKLFHVAQLRHLSQVVEIAKNNGYSSTERKHLLFAQNFEWPQAEYAIAGDPASRGRQNCRTRQ
jgi:hypothetical protein